ncbi:MAG TPA: septation protein SepH [Acidimicrobiales bacterium]|nr:septation protein SepH [Acidimicrobiales bacterium]
MQQLHLVGITTELDGLIFSGRRGSRSGSFVVPITDELLESIGQVEKLRREAEPDGAFDDTASAMRRLRPSSRPESRLTPREMQARLRAGESLSQVARAAAVDEEWVERFAAPIVAEQTRVLETALELTMTGGRHGASALPLADSVRINLHDRGVVPPPDPEGWSVHNLGGGRWGIRYQYVSRRRRQAAEWDLDMESRVLTPANRLAGEIGHVSSPRRRVPAATASEGDETAEPARPAVRKAAARRKAAPGRSVARKAGARKAAARKAAPRKAAAPKARPRKAPSRKTGPAKAASARSHARKAPVRKAPVRKAVARRAPARASSKKKASVKRAPARKAPAARRRGR